MAWRPPLFASSLVALGLASGTAHAFAPPEDGPPPAVRSVGAPPTEAECQAVAEGIARAIDDQDPAALDRLFDWDAIYESTTAGVEAPEKFRKGFIQGAEKSRLAGKGLATSIVQAVGKGGTYTLLRRHDREKGPRLLYRLLTPDAGVNYHDLPLARRGDGSVKVVDVYVFLSGEMISQTFRNLYIQAVAKASGGLLNRVTGVEQRFLKSIGKVAEMGDLLRARKFAEALAVYDGMDPEFRKQRSILLIRLQAAQGIGDDAEYGRAIEDYRTAYPDDACIDILSIDYYSLRKQWAEALACIDRLDKAVQGDPYLDVLRAGAHSEMGDPAAARADLDKAEATDPGLMQTYLARIGITLKQKDHDATLRNLRRLRDRFQVEFEDLAAIEEYKEFVASPQYQQWLEDAKARDKDKANDKD